MIPHDRIRGAFLGAALGDAFGRPFEGASRSDLAHPDAIANRIAADVPWSYSDDTEMLLGVAESLLACGSVEPEHLLRTLARNCDPARGYGYGTLRAFDHVRRGGPWRRAAFATWPEGSRGSGAAVRVVPIACLYHRALDSLDYAAQASAAVTHAHRVARVGCILHARAIATLPNTTVETLDAVTFIRALASQLHGEPDFRAKLEAVIDLVESAAPIDVAVSRLGNGLTADESVPLALYAFARSSHTFEDAIVRAVSCGGDTDTIAAMTGALAGALLGESGLPASWLARLENGPRGRDFIIELADRIATAMS